MGAIDIASKKYLADPERFADAFNYAVYGGEQVVDPRELVPLDAAEAVAMEVRGRCKAGERLRDLLKLWQAMRDDRVVHVVLGVETQMRVNYAMPVRGMLYDALNLMSQVEETKWRHRRNRRKGGEGRRRPSPAEFLSGFYKDDILMPVVTLVVHFGAEVWDGPLSIHEMLDIEDERLLQFVPDYRISLVAPPRWKRTTSRSSQRASVRF